MAVVSIIFLLPLILAIVFLRVPRLSATVSCVFPIALIWSFATWAVAGSGEVDRLGYVDYAWITVLTFGSIAAVLSVASRPSKIAIALASSWSLVLVFYSGDKVWAFPGPEGGLAEVVLFFVGGVWLLAMLLTLLSTKSVIILPAVLWFSAVSYYPILQWPPEAARQILGAEIVGSDEYYYTKITTDHVYAVEKLAEPDLYPYRVVVFVNDTNRPDVMHKRVFGYYTGHFSKVNPQFLTIPGPILCAYLPSSLHCDTQSYLLSEWPKNS